MKTINYYRQERADGGKRTGVEIDGETVLERFEPGKKTEDSALLWFVDIRCSGDHLPATADEARTWLLKKSALIQAGLGEVANELRAGIDFSAPLSRDISEAGNGVTINICCSATRRLQGREMARVLMDTSDLWEEHLQNLENLETLAR